MKKTALSLILTFSVLSANNILTEKEINTLLKQPDINYCKLVDKFVLKKEKNDFGRIITKKENAWIDVVSKKIPSLKNFEDRRKEFMKLVAFSVYKNADSYSYLMKKINTDNLSSNIKNFGIVLFFSGLRSFLKSSIGYGDLPVHEFTVDNYSSKTLKVIGKISYTQLGVLLAKQLYLQSNDKEDFADKLLLIYSYILSNAFDIKTVVNIITSTQIKYAFSPEKIKEAYGIFWDNATLARIQINDILKLLIKHADNSAINKLIYHLIKNDAISFMLKDKKVLKNFNQMKKVYLHYKKLHEC